MLLTWAAALRLVSFYPFEFISQPLKTWQGSTSSNWTAERVVGTALWAEVWHGLSALITPSVAGPTAKEAGSKQAFSPGERVLQNWCHLHSSCTGDGWGKRGSAAQMQLTFETFLTCFHFLWHVLLFSWRFLNIICPLQSLYWVKTSCSNNRPNNWISTNAILRYRHHRLYVFEIMCKHDICWSSLWSQLMLVSLSGLFHTRLISQALVKANTSV